MIDPLVSLSFAVHSCPGVYAVLVGSGISRAASIPTGQEVVIDLIRKLAVTMGEPDPVAPEEWYYDKFKSDPVYSDLLKRVGKTPSERRAILSKYFEPTADEEAQGKKTPTVAHRALAALVKSSHVRVILTTNFDRLIEQSLDAAGISPSVVSSKSAIDGAEPLRHARCTLIKVHGDYQDTRIKNTPEELAKYDGKLNRLLDQVLDEYGLITCGWSADWDLALAARIEAAKSRRYTTYWAHRGTLSAAAKKLSANRGAVTIPISDANTFFRNIEEKVAALARFQAPHPLSAKLAEATVKRYLLEPLRQIDLHDLVQAELGRVMTAVSEDQMPLSLTVTPNLVQTRVGQYESSIAILQASLITGTFWSKKKQHDLWCSVLARLATRKLTGGSSILLSLRVYPALLLSYSMGIACVVRSNYVLLKALLINTTAAATSENKSPIWEHVYPQAALDRAQANEFLRTGGQDAKTPLNDHLFKVLRDPLRSILPDDESYKAAFDRYEYIFAMICASNNSNWIVAGRFMYENLWAPEPKVATEIAVELKTYGDGWRPVKAGLFTSSQSASDANATVIAWAQSRRHN